MWFLDINIVLLYHLIHDVIAFFVSEVGNNRNRLVGLGFLATLALSTTISAWKIFWSMRYRSYQRLLRQTFPA